MLRGSSNTIALPVLLLLTGCIGHRHLAYTGGQLPPTFELTMSREAPLEGVPLPQPTSGLPRPDLGSSTYSVVDLSISVHGELPASAATLSVRFHRSRLPGRRPVVIVLPIWGGSTYPSHKITAALKSKSRHQPHVLELQGDERLLVWRRLEKTETEEEFRATAVAMRDRFLETTVELQRLLDWLERQPGVDPSRIGIVGFSMGAVVSGLLLTQEPRLAGAALVMGGAEPHEILAGCQGAIRRMRETACRRFGWTEDEFRALFEELYAPGNAANYQTRVHPSRVLIVEARRDHCMPQTSRQALWSTLGEPERLRIPWGHRASFLALTPLGFNYLRREIVHFLDVVLESPLDEAPRARTAVFAGSP